jgi:hypothetical protein
MSVETKVRVHNDAEGLKVNFQLPTLKTAANFDYSSCCRINNKTD